MKHFSLYVESSLSREVILALAVFNSRFRSSFSIASLDTGTSFLLCFLGGGREACITVVREVGSTDTKEGVVDREAGGQIKLGVPAWGGGRTRPSVGSWTCAVRDGFTKDKVCG